MPASTLYVYAIAPATVSTTSLGTGINGAELELLVSDGLAAVIHRHTAAPYEGSDDDAKRWILQHSEVVDRTWQEAGTVLPMTFNMIVSGSEDEQPETQLRRWLHDAAGPLSARLEALRERVELRVDISLDQQSVSAQSEELAELRKDMAQRPAGVRRLLTRRLEQRERDIADALADRLYPEYRRRLVECAEDLSENRHPSRTPGAVSVLTASVLVATGNVERVGVELATIRDEQPGVQINFLGPWPPYSFANVPEVTSAGTDRPEHAADGAGAANEK